MSLDFAWWSRLLGTLAFEAASISALAWLSTSLTKHPQLQRLILRTTIATWICLWGAEFVGIRTVVPQSAQRLPKRSESPAAPAKTVLNTTTKVFAYIKSTNKVYEGLRWAVTKHRIDLGLMRSPHRAGKSIGCGDVVGG